MHVCVKDMLRVKRRIGIPEPACKSQELATRRRRSSSMNRDRDAWQSITVTPFSHKIEAALVGTGGKEPRAYPTIEATQDINLVSKQKTRCVRRLRPQQL